MRLRFSRRTDYAIRAALELARAPSLMTAEEIADATGAPAGVVAQALAHLARKGIVAPVVGRSGGYRLAVAPEAVTVLDIVDAVETVPLLEARCVLRHRVCSHEGACPMHATVVAAEQAFRGQLRADTLAALAGRMAA
jgi:Rrf2 family protein